MLMKKFFVNAGLKVPIFYPIKDKMRFSRLVGPAREIKTFIGRCYFIHSFGEGRI